jgi:hypothetical protein
MRGAFLSGTVDDVKLPFIIECCRFGVSGFSSQTDGCAPEGRRVVRRGFDWQDQSCCQGGQARHSARR